MNWSRTAQYVSDILALLLIIRLAAIRVRLPGVYRVFVAFLVFQLFDSLAGLALYAFYRYLRLDARRAPHAPRRCRAGAGAGRVRGIDAAAGAPRAAFLVAARSRRSPGCYLSGWSTRCLAKF